ncbi:hypothetical protein SESBI_17030 [Sesbania bispinosa]|nr:hypothetical protein SESBI_17030 [Sesbania bispinosa]
MFGQFTGKNQTHSGLHLTRGDGWLLVVASQTRCLLSELLEDVVDEVVHDPYGLAGNADVRVHLLQHLEDVNLVCFNAFLHTLLLLVASTFLRDLLLGLGLLLRRSFLCRLILSGLLLGLLRESWMRFETLRLVEARE